MNFSPQQDQALARVQQWLHGSEQLFRLFGYAGTGKTTLAQHLGADYFAAFTGKAASVLRSKGCSATTIHRLIYLPRMKSVERLQELLRRQVLDPEDKELARRIMEERINLNKPSFILNLDSPLREAKLLVVDECSMVDERIGRDLLSFGCRVLVLGDPAQLPPVRGGGFFTNADPDVMLTEVHRQARDNPVLDLATTVRETGRLPRHQLVLERDLCSDDVLRMDQLIVGRNQTRRSCNRRIRQLLQHTDPMPQPGEKVVCLRNNHMLGILNGATYTVLESSSTTLGVDLVVRDESGECYALEAHQAPFVGDTVEEGWGALDRELFDFGYALTCHKSQGSQWPRVGIINESEAFRGSQARWLYTSITRAAEDLWITR